MTFEDYIKKEGISSAVTILNVSYCDLTDLIGIDEFVNLSAQNDSRLVEFYTSNWKVCKSVVSNKKYIN